MPGQFERHARSKWEWGLPGSRSDEVRRAAAGDDPEPAKRTAGQKNTKAWCRGKKGVPHDQQIALPPEVPPGQCRWRCGWSQSANVFGVGWDCLHNEICGRCGKILRRGWELADGECPAYPGNEVQKAEVVAQAGEATQRRGRGRWWRKPAITGPQGYRRKRT